MRQTVAMLAARLITGYTYCRLPSPPDPPWSSHPSRCHQPPRPRSAATGTACPPQLRSGQLPIRIVINVRDQVGQHHDQWLAAVGLILVKSYRRNIGRPYRNPLWAKLAVRDEYWFNAACVRLNPIVLWCCRHCLRAQRRSRRTSRHIKHRVDHRGQSQSAQSLPYR